MNKQTIPHCPHCHAELEQRLLGVGCTGCMIYFRHNATLAGIAARQAAEAARKTQKAAP